MSASEPVSSEAEATMFGDTPSEQLTVGLRPGLEVGGRYRLIAPLGKGGMGEVWEAKHLVIGRVVAIKMVLPNLGDDEAARRLQREAEVVAKLEHPNIVGVIDFGRGDSGQPFVVMERLCGRPLSAVMRERGRLPWTEARDIAVQIAAGLACAHEAGIVHRDLKPSNVFVLDDARGRLSIKLIDFGLAKLTQLGPGDRALTRSGSVFGTPAYMAPEQARGEDLDGRVDLYALGAMLYEMIVGEPLWRRATIAQLLYCHLFEPAPTLRSRVPEVPADLDALVARCLCKDRRMRPSDTDGVRRELAAAGTGPVTLVPQDAIPLPDPELRARYATVLSAAGFADALPAPRPSASRVWLVVVVIAISVAIGVVLALQLLPPPPTVPVEPTIDTPSPTVSPTSPVAPTTPAAPTPSPVEPKGDASPPVEVAPAVDAPVDVAADPTKTDGTKTNPRVRTKPRSTPKPKSDAPPSEPPPVTPPKSEPPPPKADPPVPKRKGETFEWPTP